MDSNFSPLLKTVGLAARARKVTFGTELTCGAVKDNKVSLVILSIQASHNTTKKVVKCCSENSVRLLRVSISPEELAHSVGRKKPIMTLGITDKNFTFAVLSSADKLKSSTAFLQISSESEV